MACITKQSIARECPGPQVVGIGPSPVTGCHSTLRSTARPHSLLHTYSVGMMFLPNNDADEAKGRQLAEAALTGEGFEVLGWRSVPVVPEVVGCFAKATEPRIAQIVVKDGSGRTGGDLERALYLVRKGMERAALAEFGEERATEFYVCSLSGQACPSRPRRGAFPAAPCTRLPPACHPPAIRHRGRSPRSHRTPA